MHVAYPSQARLFLAVFNAVIRLQVADFTHDFVKHLDVAQGLFGEHALVGGM